MPPLYPDVNNRAPSRWLLALVLLAVIGSAGCSARVKEAYHLRRANRYYAAGQFDRAEIEYLNVVRNDPENSQAIGRLGGIYFLQGRMQGASQFLYRAAQLNTNDLEVRVQLGQIYQTAGKLPAARAESRFVLDRQPQNAEAPIILAESSGTHDEVAAAREYLRRLPPTANQAVLQVALGILALREKDLPAAQTAFTQAQTLDPKCAVAWSAMGFLYEQQNNPGKAEAAFKMAADLSPPRSNLRLNYANFEIQTGHPEVADAFLAETIHQTPDFVSAWILRAEIAMAAKKNDDFATYLDGARALDGENYEVGLLTGKLDLARGDVAKAKAELERMAHQYYQIPDVHYLLALALLNNREVNAAVISLNRALSLQTNFTDASLLLAEVQIKSGTPEPAIALLQEVLGREPKLAQARLLLADAFRSKNRTADALVIYDQLEKEAPNNPGIPLLAGFTYEQQQNLTAARQAFSRALKLAPGDLRVLDAFVQLDIIQKQYAPAIQMLEQAVTNSAQPYEVCLMEARVFEDQGESAQTVGALEKAIALRPDVPAAHLVLAGHYLKSQESQKALAEVKSVLQKDPANSTAWMIKGQVCDLDKDYPAAADAYEQMLTIDPQSSAALNNLAYLYAEHLGRLDAAYEMAKKARELLPFDPATADTLGWVLFHRREYLAALGYLDESVHKLPGSAEVQYHDGKTHYMLGQEAAAAAGLRRALQIDPGFEGHDECQQCLDLLAIDPAQVSPADRAKLVKRVAEIPDDPVALARLASSYRQSGETAQAEQAEEAILKANPNNAHAMLELARLYAPDNVAKAFEMAKDAYAADSQDPETAGVLGHLAYETGDYKWALSLLKGAADGRPRDPLLLFDLARAAYSMGNVASARESFQGALDHGLPAAQAAQARQWLALLADVAQPMLSPEAERRSELILQSDPDNVPALMVAALKDEQTSDWAGAGQIYEKVLSLYPDFAPAQKKLALIYARPGGKTQKAIALALKAHQALPDDAELSRLLGILLYQQGDYQQAMDYLALSASARPDDAEVYYYLGGSQFQLKRLADSRISLSRALELKLSGEPAIDARRMLREIK